MRFLTCLAWCFLSLALLGCSTELPTQEPIDLPPPTPLTVAEWKELPIPEKYDYTTFERLKMNDPKLKDERQWDKFMEEVVIPERNKDIPQ